MGITFEQLSEYFDKIKAHYYKGVNDQYHPDISQELIETLKSIKLGGSGWCCQSNSRTQIFHDQLIVICLTWGGAEQCPFQSPDDKRYHSYEYGSHDWIFVNPQTKEYLHIGDLLFHQITKHHFFQSPSSPYRVDPAKMINFFRLRPNVSYQTQYRKYQWWRSNGGQSCSRKVYPDTKYTCKDISDYESDGSLDQMQQQVYGDNALYYNDKKPL